MDLLRWKVDTLKGKKRKFYLSEHAYLLSTGAKKVCVRVSIRVCVDVCVFVCVLVRFVF